MAATTRSREEAKLTARTDEGHPSPIYRPPSDLRPYATDPYWSSYPEPDSKGRFKRGKGKLTRNSSSFTYRRNLQIHSKPAIAAALELLLLER